MRGVRRRPASAQTELPIGLKTPIFAGLGPFEHAYHRLMENLHIEWWLKEVSLFYFYYFLNKEKA